MDELGVRRARRSGGGGTNGRSHPSPTGAGRRDRQDQARRHAQAAQRKASERRERQSGAAGWVADRASRWSLDGPDLRFMERQKYVWNPLMDYWFRMEIEGWEKLPDPPALLIGIHSGPRSCGTRGRSGCSGGGASATSARCTEPRTTR